MIYVYAVAWNVWQACLVVIAAAYRAIVYGLPRATIPACRPLRLRVR